jgi:hypothetical protein
MDGGGAASADSAAALGSSVDAEHDANTTTPRMMRTREPRTLVLFILEV